MGVAKWQGNRQYVSVLINSPKINQPDDIVVERNYVKIKKVQLDDRLKITRVGTIRSYACGVSRLRGRRSRKS